MNYHELVKLKLKHEKDVQRLKEELEYYERMFDCDKAEGRTAMAARRAKAMGETLEAIAAKESYIEEIQIRKDELGPKLGQ